jgi:hypothetical protein
MSATCDCSQFKRTNGFPEVSQDNHSSACTHLGATQQPLTARPAPLCQAPAPRCCRAQQRVSSAGRPAALAARPCWLTQRLHPVLLLRASPSLLPHLQMHASPHVILHRTGAYTHDSEHPEQDMLQGLWQIHQLACDVHLEQLQLRLCPGQLRKGRQIQLAPQKAPQNQLLQLRLGPSSPPASASAWLPRLRHETLHLNLCSKTGTCE